MKNNYVKMSVLGLILGAVFTVTSFTSKAEGCVFQQEFGPETTFVTDGTVAQSFVTCQSGSLAYISVFMQSLDETPFGTYLNVYSSTDLTTPVHSQQVVVPASYQKPYAKIWLTHDVLVEAGAEYILEIEVPSNRDVMFYHSDQNIYDEGNFVLNKENTSGDLAFEYGINKKPMFEITNKANRSQVQLWSPDMPHEMGCVTTQRYFNTQTTMEAAASQTFTACRTGELSYLYINATFGSQMTGNLTLMLYDDAGTLIGHTVYDPSADPESFIAAEFENVQVNQDEVYKLDIIMATNQNLVLNTVDSPQYFIGEMSMSHQAVNKNMCLYAIITGGPDSETEDEDDGDTDEDETYSTSLHVNDAKEVEELRHTVYPNPFGSNFRLSVDTDSNESAIISVYNFMGTKVYETVVENISEVNDFMIQPQGELSNGYYTLRIEYGDHIVLDTVIKQ
jgi:hypothetical protein